MGTYRQHRRIILRLRMSYLRSVRDAGRPLGFTGADYLVAANRLYLRANYTTNVNDVK
ncbi:hypothetical protein HDF13_000992 [Edaphobacter lichenicola]|uniref:Uncharacterized protein n=1 Tax=Tunturiibacter gelidiferens TaxID=3069689 RepID=A0ACC5NVN2_9BACT|nr:hypothetical protein [Edaphobacter lichenicola]